MAKVIKKADQETLKFQNEEERELWKAVMIRKDCLPAADDAVLELRKRQGPTKSHNEED